MTEQFNVFDRQNEKVLDTKSPILNVDKNGLIRFNGSAVTLMNLKPGDGVKFLQSKKDAKEWSIIKVKDPFSYPLRKLGKYGLGFNGSTLRHALLKSLIITTGGMVCPIGSEPTAVDTWSLITSAAKQRQ